MISNDRIRDLRRLYDLCARVGAKRAVVQAFKSYVRSTGEEIVSDESKRKEMILRLLTLKQRMDTAVSDAFHNIKDFNNALRDAFETFMNQKTGSKTAESLAKHLDGLLRGGAKSSLPTAPAGMTEEELQETAIDASLSLFRFLQVCCVAINYFRKLNAHLHVNAVSKN